MIKFIIFLSVETIEISDNLSWYHNRWYWVRILSSLYFALKKLFCFHVLGPLIEVEFWPTQGRLLELWLSD